MMTDVKKLQVPDPLERLGEAFREAGHELYLVGGYVRAALLGEFHKKTDATTDAHPRKIKRLLRPHAAHLWTVGERFGTIGSEVDGYEVEVTTYRSDLYTEGSRHPEVRFGESLEEDLARRDFTINAVAADTLTGEIVDPFGGGDPARRRPSGPDARRSFEDAAGRALRGDPVEAGEALCPDA
jgi:poly(A) polymerase